jgi:hypothetical protein
MRSFLGLLLLISEFVVSSISCRANLGDTLNQCTTRYGLPTSLGQGDANNGFLEWYAFKRGTLENQESFRGGIVVLEVFWRHYGGDIRAAFQPLSERDEEAILQEESTIGRWHKLTAPNKYKSTWVRSGDGATADYSFFRMTLRAGAQKH